MTEKQDKGLDLLVEIIVLEAYRCKAINEEGADAESYDCSEIEKRLSQAENYKGIFNGMSLETLKYTVQKALEVNNFKFSDRRCYSYLYDVISDDLKYFN